MVIFDIYIFIKLLQVHPGSSPMATFCHATEVRETTALVFYHAKPLRIAVKGQRIHLLDKDTA